MKRQASYTFFLFFLPACRAADAGTFFDSFAGGLNPKYWSVLQTVSNFYSVSLPPNQVQVDRDRQFSQIMKNRSLKSAEF
jgi:hypothetical protein